VHNARERTFGVSRCEGSSSTLRWSLSLRIAFDLDGVLADMGSALTDQTRALFGKAGGSGHSGSAPSPEPAAAGAAGPIPGPATLNLTPRQRRKLWRRVAGIENFWETLAEIEPGAVKRLATVSADRKWEVIFLTRRPETAGLSAQAQSQRWLVSQGFERPSVYVVKGSRGRIAAALELDVVVDDLPENCCDVVAESGARAFLVWRAPGRHYSTTVDRLGVRVVRTMGECLDRLLQM
jgi:hypothetical protein